MIESVLGKSVAANLSTGGTVDGDLTVTGSLGVGGDVSINLTSVVSNSTIIDATGTEAFLVRANSDAGDTLIVDTTNRRVGLNITPSASLDIRGDDLFIGNSATDASSRIMFVEKASDRTQGFSLLYAGSSNPTLGGQSFTASANTFNIFRHNGTAGGENVLSINRTDGNATFSGDILGIDGSNSSPSFSFSSDADTGMYREGTNEIGFATGGSRSLKLDASLNAVFSGDIYVNNSTPSLNLQDSDGSNQSLEILHSGANTFFTSRNDSSNGAFFFRGYNGSSYSTALTLDSSQNATFSGNVGIGTSPSDTLHLSASVPIIRLTDSDTNDYHRIYGSNGGLYFDADKGNSVGSSVMAFGVDDSRVMTLVSGGNVGIGTNLPSGKLTLSNGSASAPLSITASNSYIQLGSEDFGSGGLGKFMIGFGYTDVLTNTNAPAYIGFEETSTSGDTKGDLTFYTRNVTTDTLPTKRLTISADGSSTFSGAITSGGNVTIPAGNLLYLDGGTDTYIYQETDNKISFATNSGVRLSIDNSSSTFSGDVSLNSALTLGVSGSTNGKINTPESMYFNIDSDNSQTDTEFVFGKNRASDSGGSELMRLTESGMLGINDNNPSHPLSVNGAVTVYGQNTVHDVSAMVLGQESSSKSQIRVYGADGTTEGSLEIVTSASDGVPTTTVMLLDSNSRISLSNNDSGTLNTIFGYQAGNVLASGSTENTVFGHQAGLALSTGDYNTAVGALALKSEDGGNRAVAVGTGALFSQNVSDIAGNVAVGFTAGYYNVTGTLNTWVGHEAGLGASGQSNSQNTGIGYRVGYSLTTGSNNTFLGRQTGLVMTDGADNTFVGMNAGAGTVSGTKMVAIGNQSLFSNATTDATGTVAIGYESLNALTSGAGNLAIGFEALKTHTTGAKNMAIGYQSMFDTDAGSNSLGSTENVFIGYQSGSGTWADSATSYNTGIGNSVMRGACDGATNNTGVGYQALKSVTSGDSNTAVGSSALEDNTTARYNTSVGASALQYNTNGEHNVAIGLSAGRSDSSGSNATSPDQCVAIGSGSQFSSTTPTNQTVVGYNAIGGGDNSVVLGNSSVTAVLCASDGEAQVYASAIRFPANQVANSNANALDDYEEGTWSITDGSGAGLSFTLENNAYVKIGKLVTASAIVTFPSTSNSSSALLTLPFNASSVSSASGGAVLEQNINSAKSYTMAVDVANGVKIRENGSTTQTNANLSGKKIRFIITYYAS